VAKAAPKENDGAAAGVAVDPKEGAEETEVTAPKVGTGAVVALDGVEPNVNNPGVAAAVVAEAAEGAAPKVKGLTEATDVAVVVVVDTVEVAPNVGAAVDAAGAPEKLKSPEEDAAIGAVSVLDEAVVLPPKVNGFVSAVVLVVDPNEGRAEAVEDAEPNEKEAEVGAAAADDDGTDAPKLKVGVGSVFETSVVLEEPNAKTADAAVDTVTLTGTELTDGPSIFAAPNVNGTEEFAEDFFSDSVITVEDCTGLLGPKLITFGTAADVVVVAGGGATDVVVDVAVANSEVAGKLKVGIGKPPWDCGLVTSAG